MMKVFSSKNHLQYPGDMRSWSFVPWKIILKHRDFFHQMTWIQEFQTNHSPQISHPKWSHPFLRVRCPMPKYSFYGWGSGLNRMGPNQQKMEYEIMGHCWIHFPHDFLGNINHHHIPKKNTNASCYLFGNSSFIQLLDLMNSSMRLEKGSCNKLSHLMVVVVVKNGNLPW